MNNEGHNKNKTPKRFQYMRFYKNGEQAMKKKREVCLELQRGQEI